MPEHDYAVIMAGGGGTRLWPVSRKDRPKQLLPLIGKETLLQSTVKRLGELFPVERIVIVTVREQLAEIQDQIPGIPTDNYLIEPSPRGTASVVGLAAIVLHERDPKAVMAVLPSDHFIRDRDLFTYVLREAIDIARKGYLITLGITPISPATGYGYIRQGRPLEEHLKYPAYQVESFTEKPDEETAQLFLGSGLYFWNSGMFVWRTDSILGEIRRQLPQLAKVLDELSGVPGPKEREARLQKLWPKLAAQTIDYGIMEHAERVVVVPAGGLGWSDVGAWDSLFEVLLPDMNGNVTANTRHLAVDTHNTLVYGRDSERLIATVGIDDTVVVDTGDVLLVCKADQAQKVRELVERLKSSGQDKYL